MVETVAKVIKRENIMKRNKEKTRNKRFAGLKSEFSKITWPEPKMVAKQSVAVVIVSVITGLIIVLLDAVIQLGGELLAQL